MEVDYPSPLFGGDRIDTFSSMITPDYDSTKLAKVLSHEPVEAKISHQKETSYLQPDPQTFRMHRFVLYETMARFYLVGIDACDLKHQILKIDRILDKGELSLSEDGGVYNKEELHELLNAIDDGNRSSGGLKLRAHTNGLLGFIRFTGDYYLLLVTKKKAIAMIGGHYIYQIEGTEMIPLASTSTKRTERHAEETRFVGILKNLDLTRYFYFSHSYDITNTLQKNIAREREHVAAGGDMPYPRALNEMFVWNHYLLRGPAKHLSRTFDWFVPIIHGFVNQATLSIYGRLIYITVIARRSRFFAGARFLKRGANDMGYVANDVETEQIVADMSTTSFHAPGPVLYANPNYTSYVQHRGSIPLHWTQDNTGVAPKPGIDINVVDPFYSAAAKHFDDLFRRYGAPVFVLNLVKARERTPRESKLLVEFTTAIKYLNQFLPTDKKIIHKAWDMSRAAKTQGQDVIATLEGIAEDVLATTGLFHNGKEEKEESDDEQDQADLKQQYRFSSMQHGIARTNCIDCLDRTNTAQMVIAKLALGHQLYCLGVIDSPVLEHDTDAVNLFEQMFHDHGNAIAIQYGGSHLVNTMETYRKINQWSSGSRDVLESVKRYYHNSFLDGQRQEAYNLFLGNYIFVHDQPMLWELITDYYLHHADPRSWAGNLKRNYIQWFTAENLEPKPLPPAYSPPSLDSGLVVRHLDNYWLEYYKPQALTSLQKVLPYKMDSTRSLIPPKTSSDKLPDLSPFRPRTSHDSETNSKSTLRKGVTILDQAESISTFRLPISPPLPPTVTLFQSNATSHSLPNTPGTALTSTIFGEKDRAAITRITLEHIISQSLHPDLSDDKIDEYTNWLDQAPALSSGIGNPGTNYALNNAAAHMLQNDEYTHWSYGLTSDELAARSSEEDVFAEHLVVGNEPFRVTEEDLVMKQYKPYRQWLRGKPLFKQVRNET